jgi:hypothetical protein
VDDAVVKKYAALNPAGFVAVNILELLKCRPVVAVFVPVLIHPSNGGYQAAA